MSANSSCIFCMPIDAPVAVLNGIPVWLLVQVGKKNRSTGATLMNQDSSRSHSIFCITVEILDTGPALVRRYRARNMTTF